MYIKIIVLLLLGLAALFILLAVKYYKESSGKEDEKVDEEYPGEKKRSKKKTEQLPACVQESYKLKDEVTSAFFEEVVRPFLDLLQERGTLDVVMRILMILSTEGNIPSVAGPADSNMDSYYSYTVLKKVSLAQHSVDTARIGMEILKEEFPYFYRMIPDKYLVLFLGHDLGKVALSKGYTSCTAQDYPIFFAQILSKFIPESVLWRNDVIDAVIKQHSSVNLRDPYSSPEKSDLWLLRTADRKARESELRSSLDLNSWPTKLNQQPDQASGAAIQGILPAEILKEILPLVNHIVSSSDPVFNFLVIPPDSPEGNFLAVSQPDGVVYICPDVIYYAFIRVVIKNAVQRENAAVLAKPKNEALKDIVHWLAVNNCIPPEHLKPGYYGCWYSFSFRPGSQRTYQSFFTPIIIQAFGVDVLVGDLEAKRREVAKIANLTIRKFNR